MRFDLVLLFRLAFSYVPENFRTRLVRDSGGQLELGVRVRGIIEQVTITMSRYSSMRRFHDQPNLVLTSSTDNEDYRFSGDDIGSSDSSSFGFGVGGTLLNRWGSVAVIKDGEAAELVIGSALDDFVSYCQPESTMALNESNPGVAVSLGDEDMGEFQLSFESRNEYKIGTTATVFDRLVDLITSHGVVRAPNRLAWAATFSNCTQDIHAFLPMLRIMLRDDQGHIVVFPDDYLPVDSINNRCDLHVVNFPTAEGGIWVNPFLLVDTNVRISSFEGVQLCDTNGF